MSDVMIGWICGTIMVLGFFVFIGWFMYLDYQHGTDTTQQMQKRGHGNSPTETPKVPPKGGMPPQGHQPTSTVNRNNPPKGGSAILSKNGGDDDTAQH